MLLRLTQPEMLKQWRLLTLLEPLAPAESEADIERTDALDTDSICIAKMRAWYLRQLDTAPTELLEVTDISGAVTLHCRAEEDACTISLPPSVRRVLGVRLSGWRYPVTPVSVSDIAAERLSASTNPYLRGGDCAPLAVIADRTIHILSTLRPEARIEELTVIAEPADEMYVMDEMLLGDITSQHLNL